MNTATETKKYKPYPKYKDSGVDWLGDVPEHWEVWQVGQRLQIKSGDAPPMDKSREHGDYPVYGANGVIGYAGSFNNLVERITLGRVGAIGAVNIAPPKVWISDNALILLPDPKSDCLMFLFYFFCTTDLAIESTTNAQPLITATQVKRQKCAFPPFPEQQAIAEFLDCRTSEIDDLIAKKEQVIELLREKRIAIISHAVTKGLNPDAKMKDSGVGWLGKVPKHWEVKRLRHIIEGTLVNGLFKKKEYFGSGVNLINVFDIYRDNFLVDTDGLERVEANKTEIEKYAVKSGDIFFVRSSLKLEGVGKSVCILDVAEPTVFECHVVRARPDTDQILPVFLINYLNSTITMNRLISLANMVTMTTLDQIKMKDVEVAVPPIVEQVAIAKYLKQEYLKTDALISKVIEAIEKLKEYRTALISAAVTGKIDVRERVSA